MSSEEIIEEILYNSYRDNIASEVMEMAVEIQKKFPKISKVESYERSYEIIKKK